ncbi:putative RNA-binding protein sce3 [Cytospora mali]|uniref:RNA-binding protein sce3 n=1 Tax=Cytospora mali TaxID=578113 RepID=A0A194VLM8_CYTMA|nr:putative RNA-binding protein sce3 [Valsa mali]
MAPKKKEVQKLSLNEFMQDSSFGGGSNWADEVEETYGTQPLPSSDRRLGGGGASSFGGTDRFAGYARQERSDFPQTLPDKPPYTAHLGNLSYDATQETVTDFFTGCEVVSVRIVEDRAEMRPKGFGYAEFATVDGLKKALELDGESFNGRNIRIRIADPPKDRQEGGRDLDWGARRGPLASEPPRNDRRGPRDFNEPRAPRETGDDSRYKEVSWERRGPLSPVQAPVMARGGSRDGSRPRRSDTSRADPFRRGTSPAAWGPGEGRQEGSRPPIREFVERPERAPTAAERDNQWRSNMRPDAAAARSPVPSRAGSEAPSSPALAPAAPAGRPKLNLQKRTVAEAPAVMSPSLSGADSKASPFGAARPIDTAAREREIAEKHEQMLKEKKEADEKAKEERRLAKEAAAKEAAEKAAAEEATAAEEAAKPNGDAEEEKDVPPATEATPEAPKDAEPENVEAAATPETAEVAEAGENGDNAPEQKLPVRAKEPKEPREPAFKSRAAESGSWRQASGDRARGPPSGPRERRGGGASRGSGRGGLEERQPSRRGEPSTPTTPVVDEDGWTTVPAGAKGRRGRPVVS